MRSADYLARIADCADRHGGSSEELLALVVEGFEAAEREGGLPECQAADALLDQVEATLTERFVVLLRRFEPSPSWPATRERLIAALRQVGRGE